MVVRFEKTGAVTTVINDRINARNAGDPETADALVEAFLAFESDPDARVAVFWGAGGTFCAGWDLKYAATLADREKFQREIVEGLAFPPGAAPAPRGPLGPSRLELSRRSRARRSQAAWSLRSGAISASWRRMHISA